MKRLILLLCLSCGPAFAACPDPQLGEVTDTAAGPELIMPQSWSVEAQGVHPVPCGSWAINGVQSGEVSGFLPEAPTAVFELVGMAPHILMVMAEASCAPQLAVRSADGLWHFGETANAREEVVVWGAPDGPLQVWIGAETQTSCPATVILETFDR